MELLRDTELVSLLEAFDTRQVLHVTFRSILARHGGTAQNSFARKLEGLRS